MQTPPTGTLKPRQQRKIDNANAKAAFNKSISATYLPGVSMSPKLAAGRGRGVRKGGQIAHQSTQWGGASRNRYYTPGQGGRLVSYGVGEAASKFGLLRSKYQLMKGNTQPYKQIDRNLYKGDLGSRVNAGMSHTFAGKLIDPGGMGDYFQTKAGFGADEQDAMDAKLQEAHSRTARWHKIMKVLNAADVKAGYEPLDTEFVSGPVAPKFMRPTVRRPRTVYS